MPQIPYAKPYVSIIDQVALLRSRGMEITDQTKAEECLRRIGYYRLSGYWYPMRQVTVTHGPAAAPVYQVQDAFKEGARFCDVVDLYVFDKKLRMLMLDAIERVEVALRVDVALALGLRGPTAHRDPRELHPNFAVRPNKRGQVPHLEWMARLDDASRRSSEDFVKHFHATYSTDLPIWVAIELWDFGMLSHLVGGLKYDDQTAMARRYGLPRGDVLASWVRSINFVRNVCAHHSRLWNRSIVDEPRWTRPGEVALLDHLANLPKSRGRVYGVAASLQWLMRHVNPSSTWTARLSAHMDSFPVSPLLNREATGFPGNWSNEALWQ